MLPHVTDEKQKNTYFTGLKHLRIYSVMQVVYTEEHDLSPSDLHAIKSQ